MKILHSTQVPNINQRLEYVAVAKLWWLCVNQHYRHVV